jgi:hypothetical protein
VYIALGINVTAVGLGTYYPRIRWHTFTSLTNWNIRHALLSNRLAAETDNTAMGVTDRDANVGHKSPLGISLNTGDDM